MESSRVLLAQLYSNLQPPNAEPFSIEVLAAHIEKNAGDISVDLCTVNPVTNIDAVDDLVHRLETNDYKLLGLSIPQGTYATARAILERISNTKSSFLIVLGHAIPTYAPELFLQDFPSVVIVHGWGEDAITQLIRFTQFGAPTLNNITNISYFDRQIGKITSNPISYLSVPSPAKRMDAHRYFARIETSRGCHYGACTFCTRPPGRANSWQRLPIEQTLQSIQELKSAGIGYFTFTDEDFIGNDLQGALEIAEGMMKIGDMRFSISLRADNVLNPALHPHSDENRLRAYVISQLKRAGLSFMFIGLESVSDSQLRRYGKGISAKHSIESINIVQEYGVVLEVGFMLFDPFVSLSELQEIAKALRRSGVWRNVGDLFSALRVQRASAFETWLMQKGLLKRFDPNLLSYEWSYQDSRVAEIAEICTGWASRFHMCQRLVRNLKRTDITNEIAKRFMESFRKLDLLVLENVLSYCSIDRTYVEMQSMINSFEMKRYALTNALISELEQAGHKERIEVVNLLTELEFYRLTTIKNLGNSWTPVDEAALRFIIRS